MANTLVEKFRDGDDSLFEEIYGLYHFKIFSFIKKYTAQLADAKDITQNVFIHLWKYRNKLDTSADLESILYKSSRQEISKWYKKQNQIFSVEEAFLISELDFAEEPEDSLEARMEEIQCLLDQIPERRRKIFTLHRFEDRSYQEIALEMHMSTSAVANQISKTLQFLKKNSIKHHELYWFAFMFLGD